MKHWNNLKSLAVALVITFTAAFPAVPAAAAGENITIDTSLGIIGQSITVSGSGFSTGSGTQSYAVDIHFGRNPGTQVNYTTGRYVTLLTQSLNTNGTFSTTVAIPSVLDGGVFETVASGIYYLFVTYRILGSSTPRTPTVLDLEAFSVLGGDLTISPSSGYAGTEAFLSGSGFTANEELIIRYNENEILTAISGGTAMVNGMAANIRVYIPSSTAGIHALTITGKTSGHQIGNIFTVQPNLIFRPVTGVASNTISMYGTGFGGNVPVEVAFNNVVLYNGATDSIGAFSTVFPAKKFTKGTYTVRGADSLGNTAQVTYNIFDASATLEPASGSPGWEVLVKGEGFQPNKKVTISFEGISDSSNVVANANADGAFNTIFTIPWPSMGKYDVEITDGTNSQTAEFEVTTSAAIEPRTNASVPGNSGEPVAIAGSGFLAGRTVTVTFSGTVVTTDKVEANGTFNIQFNAPSTIGGPHIIEATDGTNTIRYGFYMEEEPPDTPVIIEPAPSTKASAETHFSWGEVVDPSSVTYTLQVATNPSFETRYLVLDETGLMVPEYTVPKTARLNAATPEAPYYWRVKAVDMAHNESPWSEPAPFYIGFGFGLPQGAIYAIIVGAALALAAFTFWLGRKTAFY